MRSLEVFSVMFAIYIAVVSFILGKACRERERISVSDWCTQFKLMDDVLVNGKLKGTVEAVAGAHVQIRYKRYGREKLRWFDRQYDKVVKINGVFE